MFDTGKLLRKCILFSLQTFIIVCDIKMALVASSRTDMEVITLPVASNTFWRRLVNCFLRSSVYLHGQLALVVN